MLTQKPKYLAIDFETTGLDTENALILEVHAVLLDEDLERIDEYDTVIAHTRDAILEACNDFVRETHTKNGLIEECHEMMTGDDPEFVSESDMRNAIYVMIYDAVTRYETASGEEVYKPDVMLLGNSVHFDAALLRRDPNSTIADLLSHRIIDCSSFLYLVRLPHLPPNDDTHRARGDIYRSIEIARRYKNALRGTCR